MKYEDLIKKLESIKTPEIEIQSHQRRLKLTLLNSGYWKDKKAMSLLKKFAPIFAPVGALAVIAILVVVGIGYLKNPSSVSQNSLLEPPVAYAKELVGLAQEQLAKAKAVAAIPDPSTGFVEWKTPDADGNIRDEKGNIIYITTPEGELVPTPYEVPARRETITKDFALLLEEAHQAKDLAYIGDKVLPDGKKVKVLRFTKDGNTVILGIDANNLPAVKIVFDSNGDGIIFEQGKIKSENPPYPSGEGIQYGEVDQNALGPDIEQQIKYWTENLEQPTDFRAIQK